MALLITCIIRKTDIKIDFLNFLYKQIFLVQK